ncbi:TPA: sulfurtransferase [Photobacterium damselae]
MLSRYSLLTFILFFIITMLVLYTQKILANESFVITPLELQTKLSSQPNSLLIYDVRSVEQYNTEHIPQAISFPFMSTYEKKNNGYYVKDKKHIEFLLREHGITNDKMIVLYDDGSLFHASRLYWVLALYGVKNIKIINGGLTLWKQQYSTSKIRTDVSNSEYIPILNSSIYANQIIVKIASHNQDIYSLLDSRSYEEYIGETSVTDKQGHIPNALFINLKDFFVELPNGVNWLKNIEYLKDNLSHIPRTKKIITYCNKGTASGLSFLILKYAGYNVAHYDGSWIDWSLSDLPVEK